MCFRTTASPAEGWATREEAFDHETRDETPLAKAYRAVVDAALDEAEADAKENGAPPVAALVMECVLHGAGGMDLIDPTFQRATIQACRARGLPVVLDEVFAGIWRLGAEGAWELLGEKPDVSCYAKLFTGGLTPLAATATTEEVFDAFRGPTKQNALLHGHSYTAYPIGCAVAAEAQRMYRDPLINDNLVEMGGGDARAASGPLRVGGGPLRVGGPGPPRLRRDFLTLVPIRPRSRGERRSLRT
jgi:dethiobiotin synthetase/adenosylmethionine--8-amino-7-oxononanoate aminotransferase